MGNYYHLLDTLKNHFDNDAFVNTVTEGDIFKVDLAKQTIFPLTHIIVNNSTIENNMIRFNVMTLFQWHLKLPYQLLIYFLK